MVVRYKNIVLGQNVKVATTFFERLRGVMFMDSMEGMDGLIIDECKSVHNFFVKFPLDLLFLSNTNEVVKVVKNFRPWHITGIYFKAKRVLELPAGVLPDDIQVGSKVEITYV